MLKLEKLASSTQRDDILNSLPNLSESKTSFVKHMKQRNLISQQSAKNSDILDVYADQGPDEVKAKRGSSVG